MLSLLHQLLEESFHRLRTTPYADTHLLQCLPLLVESLKTRIQIAVEVGALKVAPRVRPLERRLAKFGRWSS